jgi:hypothetical protein
MAPTCPPLDPSLNYVDTCQRVILELDTSRRSTNYNKNCH